MTLDDIGLGLVAGVIGTICGPFLLATGSAIKTLMATNRAARQSLDQKNRELALATQKLTESRYQLGKLEAEVASLRAQVSRLQSVESERDVALQESANLRGQLAEAVECIKLLEERLEDETEEKG